MFSFLKKFIFYIGNIFSFLIPFKTVYLIDIIFSFFYTGLVKRFFKKFGNNSNLKVPSTLIGPQFITLGNNCLIGKRVALTAWDRYKGDSFKPTIFIGDNVNIGDDCHITAINNIQIGDNVLIGKKITITDNSHGRIDKASILLPPAMRSLHSPGEVIIEDGVWIGDKVSILPNVRIGRNSIIGANSVVTSDVQANCVYAGVPARKIKEI